MLDEATRKHIMSFDEPEPLRKHILDAHTFSLPSAVLVRNADHQELDGFHIEAHEK